MKRLLPFLALVALVVPAFGQGGSKNVVSVSANSPKEPVAAGYSLQVSVLLQVKAGYHINAQKPSEDYLIGTKLDLKAPDGMKVAKVAYPRAKMATFEFSETPLAVYDGTVELVATLKTEKSLEPGPREILGKVTFQACNDQSCLAPSTVDIKTSVTISEPAQAATGSVSVTGAPPDARVAIDGKSVGRTDARGSLVAREVEVGKRRVRVDADGFAPFEQNVTVEDGKPQTLAVAMAPTEGEAKVEEPAQPVAAVAPQPEPPAPAPAARNDEPNHSSSSLYMPFLLIGAVVGAAISLVFVLARRRSTSATPHAK